MAKESENQAVDKRTIPVVEEELQVNKRTVETGITRVTIKVNTAEQLIEEPLAKQKVVVEHVAIDRFIDHPVETRTEGDVTIIPIMEEVLVVEKKLRLKEELHIRRQTETVMHRQKEAVRKGEAVVEHTNLRISDNDR